MFNAQDSINFPFNGLICISECFLCSKLENAVLIIVFSIENFGENITGLSGGPGGV